MTSGKDITRILQRKGSAAVRELAVLGLSRSTLYRALRSLEQSGQIIRLRRGTYAYTSDRPSDDSWSMAMQRYPKGVLCLLSALLFHRLTTQAPSAVWLALPKGSRPPTRGYPVITSVYLSGASYTTAMEVHNRSEGKVRVYSVSKTVADCFKFRNRIGLDVALEALREGWRERRFTLDELDRMARVCRVQAVMRPYVEALVS
jgi:predicted transcriptional regulator of viral defense system